MKCSIKVNVGKISSKTEKPIVLLELKKEKFDINQISEFLNSLLEEILHHRNQLKHLRHCIQKIDEIFTNSINIDVDFAEKMKVPVKDEPQ